VRRSGPIGQLEYGADPCDYIGPTPLEEDCYESPLWFARSISEGNFSEPSLGDSGGGLFTNIELGCTNSNQGTSTVGLLVGALSGWHDAADTRARWAPLYHQRKFVCDRLNVPVARTVAQARADGVYALGNINLNDRARVVAEPTGAIGAPVSAVGNVNVGTDVLVGAVDSGSDVWLRERARVQNQVRATGDITTQNGVSTGGRTAGTCTKLEPFALTAPFAAGTQNRTLENVRGPAIADYSLTPSDTVRDLVVRARVRLTLGAGLYVFRNFDLEAGAILKVPAGTWIYITGTGEQRIRGDIDAAANTIFWGVPNAASVVLGGEWRGAMVAPRAHVNADMRDMAMLSGNFFVNHFTLHQGRWLFAVPFTGPWVPTCAPNRTNCQ
jgi:hypothetical protein